MICKISGFPQHASIKASLSGPDLELSFDPLDLVRAACMTHDSELERLRNTALFFFYSSQMGFC